MLFWERPDLLEQLSPNVDMEEVRKQRKIRLPDLDLPRGVDLKRVIEPLPTADDFPGPLEFDFSGDEISIGKRSDLNDEQFALLDAAIRQFHPWRKGPWKFFDFEVDAEWRSNLKWDRIAPVLGDISKKRILDVGCGNAYYMFRAAAMNPELLIGLDPSIPFYLMFEMVQRFLQIPNMQYDRLGCEDLTVFDRCFDWALCMGILYHQRNPVQILRDLRNSLVVGGRAIVESQSIPGDGSMALFPENRYAKARNVYFVPTQDCLVNWVRRAGFKDVEVVSHCPVTTEEQRMTEFMTYHSLAEFLDPEDSSKTAEGYPAPWRTVVVGTRKYLD